MVVGGLFKQDNSARKDPFKTLPQLGGRGHGAMQVASQHRGRDKNGFRVGHEVAAIEMESAADRLNAFAMRGDQVFSNLLVASSDRPGVGPISAHGVTSRHPGVFERSLALGDDPPIRIRCAGF